MEKEAIHAVIEKELDENKDKKFTGQTVIIINSRDGGAGKIQVEKRAKKEYK